MNRRGVVLGFGAIATAWPFAARAQQPAKMARIGYLTFRTPNAADDAFVQGLRDLNWIEAQNIVIERRHPAGDASQLKRFAAELVRLKPDVIVTAAAAATMAVKEAGGTVPVVFLAAGDPVGQRLVESLGRPGGNITGVSFDATAEITAKQLQLLTEATPGVGRVAVLWNSASPFLRSYWHEAQTAAPALHVELQPAEVTDAKQLERAFDVMSREHAEALVVLSDSFATFNRSRIAELAVAHRLPAIYGHSGYIEAGGLMSYGPSLTEVYRHGASYVDKILRGTRPSELPVEQPTKFELVINLKTSKALGLEIPPTLLARADQVIE